MNWKNLSLIIGIYLVVFGFIFYLLLPTESDDTIDDVSAGEALGYFFSNFRSSFTRSILSLGNSFGFVSDIRLSRYFLSSSCNFRRDIACEYFTFDLDKQEVVFQLVNKMDKFIYVLDVELRGDINCYAQSNATLRKDAFFFIRLDDCIFNGTESTIRLRYHEGNPNFYRVVEGRLIAK